MLPLQLKIARLENLQLDT